MPDLAIVIIDDHPVLSHALGDALARLGLRVRVIGTKGLEDDDVAVSAVAEVAASAQVIVLLDLHLGERLAIPLVAPLVALGAHVLLMTASTDDDLIAEAIAAGAEGIVSKGDPFDELVRTIDGVAKGRPALAPNAHAQLVARGSASRLDREARLAKLDRLSRTERAILAALVEGHPTDHIAETRGVTTETVRSHVKTVLRKLEARDRVHAVAMARAAGFTD